MDWRSDRTPPAKHQLDFTLIDPALGIICAPHDLIDVVFCCGMDL